MDVRALVLACVVFGVASCALGVARRARASLACASGGAACLGAIAAATSGVIGALPCLALCCGGAVRLICDTRGSMSVGAAAGPLTSLSAIGLLLYGLSGESPAGLAVMAALLALALGALYGAGHEAMALGATIIALALLAWGMLDGNGVVSICGTTFDVAPSVCLLVSVATACALSQGRVEPRPLRLGLGWALVALLQLETYTELAALVATCAVLLVMRARRRWLAALTALSALALCWACGLLLSGDALGRWLGAPSDPYGAGYQLRLFNAVLGDTGALGTGEISQLALSIPSGGSTYALAWCASALGWAGIALPPLCVASAVVASMRSLSAVAPAQRPVQAVLLATLALSALGNVLYVFHVVPVPALPFPLLSVDLGSLVPFVGVLCAVGWSPSAQGSGEKTEITSPQSL